MTPGTLPQIALYSKFVQIRRRNCQTLPSPSFLSRYMTASIADPPPLPLAAPDDLRTMVESLRRPRRRASAESSSPTEALSSPSSTYSGGRTSYNDPYEDLAGSDRR